MNIVTVKIISFVVMLLIANRWATGALDKGIAKIRQFKRRYGVTTMLLIVAWWLITPSASVDDWITYQLIMKVGLAGYIGIVVALTLYLIYRMRVTIVIYD